MKLALYKSLPIGSTIVLEYYQDSWHETRRGDYLRLSEPVEVEFKLLPASGNGPELASMRRLIADAEKRLEELRTRAKTLTQGEIP